MITSTNPLVSVIIPCYNHGRYLSAAVNSALNQTYRPIEVIVVDDGSTDNTQDVARSFGNRIKYIRQSNAGPSVARNCAIRQSTGDLIAMLDADDEWRPRKLELQVPSFLDAANVGLAVTGFRWFCTESGESGTRVPIMDSDLQHDLLRNCLVGALTAVFPRRVFDDVGDFDPTLRSAQDWDMWLRIAKKYDVVYIPDVLADYRLEAGSQSTNARIMFDNRMRLLSDDRMFHGNCEKCRAALRAARRGAHVSLAAEYCRMARESARDHKYLVAVLNSLRAIKHDPNASLRMGRRLATGKIG